MLFISWKMNESMHSNELEQQTDLFIYVLLTSAG